jgi:hypothetical protein
MGAKCRNRTTSVGCLDVVSILDAPKFRLFEAKSMNGNLFADWRRDPPNADCISVANKVN